jgi:hypothetical protein
MLARAQLIVLLALSFVAGSLVVFAQDDEDRYQEEYDRVVNQIAKVKDPARRAEQLIAFYKSTPNMDPRIKPFADDLFTKDLNELMMQQKMTVVKKLAESAVAVRPKFAQSFFFYGVILKSEKKYEEASNALAKSYVIASASKSPIKDDAKKQLDLAYREAHKGSMVGEDKLIKKIEEEMK